MQTRTYDELYELIQALCGVTFASIEEPRIRALVNRRASKAYKASNYWTRFLLVGEEVLVTSGTILYSDQVSGEKIDTFLRIYKTRPYQSLGVNEHEFVVTSLGARLINYDSEEATGTAYVTAKTQLLDKYGNGSGYTQSVPREWFEYLAHGTYADYLRAEGQQEKAALADQEANEILLDELMKLDEQHTQTIISNRISTNANMQYRNSRY
jgi:hypothetical protein